MNHLAGAPLIQPNPQPSERNDPDSSVKPSLLASAPGDILLEIASCFESRSDLLHFCLTSNHIFFNTSPALYATVVLTSVEQCTLTLGMLRLCPEIACHVRELVIRHKSISNCGFSDKDAGIVSSAVRELAAAMRMDALTTFVWDGDEMPYNEDMWFALRMFCPQLRYISTTLGACLPTPNSHLFDFVDLRGFSLTLTPNFYHNQVDMFLAEEQSSSRKFWDMLIKRCPNLEELTIDGISSLPTDAHTLVDGRWPKLRKLTLGDISIDWRIDTADNPAQKRPFITFLEAHPALQSLSLSKYNIQPTHFAELDPVSLKLTEFCGTLQQLQALPHLQPHLKSVTFREPMQTREVTALAVAGLLQNLASLTELKISFILHSMYDSGNLLRSLISSCPNLQHLELTCAHKPSFQLDLFSKTIRGFPKLRVLHLTIVKYPGDETLASGAARIARANPRLEQFTLTFLPPSHPLPLPYSLPSLPFPLPVTATGVYELACDEHGLPVSLASSEHRQVVWPFGLGVSSCKKKYVNDLRPLGYPGRKKQGLMSLLLERSAAGEEMRMILFCALLVCLSMWGFTVCGRTNASGRFPVAGHW